MSAGKKRGIFCLFCKPDQTCNLIMGPWLRWKVDILRYFLIQLKTWLGKHFFLQTSLLCFINNSARVRTLKNGLIVWEKFLREITPKGKSVTTLLIGPFFIYFFKLLMDHTRINSKTGLGIFFQTFFIKRCIFIWNFFRALAAAAVVCCLALSRILDW